MKYLKRPVVIEAVLWDETMKAFDEVSALTTDRKVEWNKDGLHIHTLEGVMHATKGDYIIRGVKGEIYPCKPDIFESTYDPT